MKQGEDVNWGGRPRFVRTLVASSMLILLFAFSRLPIFSSAEPAVDAPVVSTSATDPRLAVFDDVWQTVSERYYDSQFNGIDWQGQRDRLRPLASSATDSAELYRVLRRLVGVLGDAHTRVFSPEQKFDWQHPRFIGVGLSLREISGIPTVVSVERGSKAEHVGVRPGDQIVSLDGKPAMELFKDRLSNSPGASTRRAARANAVATLFDGRAGSTVDVTWSARDGKQQTTMLLREWRELDTRLRVRHLQGYALISFDLFTPDIATDLSRLLAGRLEKERGIIIDLRNNGGGDAEVMTEIASGLLPPGTNLGSFADRAGRTIFQPLTGVTLLPSTSTAKTIRASLVILASERTSSAAEILVEALKAAHRATIVGTVTCGCVLAIRQPHILPDGGELDVSELDYHTPSGSRLEGAGVTPDALIAVNAKDLVSGRDRALEAAVDLLDRTPRNPH